MADTKQYGELFISSIIDEAKNASLLAAKNFEASLKKLTDSFGIDTKETKEALDNLVKSYAEKVNGLIVNVNNLTKQLATKQNIIDNLNQKLSQIEMNKENIAKVTQSQSKIERKLKQAGSALQADN